MPNRRTATYSELFQRLKQEATVMSKQFDPRHIISDFEAALILVIRQEFPAATHTGCMFHFNQSIHRKIMGLGLGTDYAQDASIREQCKQLMALCLMPVSEVEYEFKRIRSIASPSLDDLFTYFYRQWIDGNVPLSMWNFYDLDHRTNNICEAYNRRFGTRVMKKHPNLWTFIQLIQSENARCEHLIIQLDAGASSSKQSTRTTMFQRRFETLKTRFSSNEISAKMLLDKLGLLIGGHKI
ncbi:unnamed protein product [Rotaria sp. Silwood2]|nr:unnamed protein product [Rotaria sp. Silwood2]CAF3444414.1 unnamed protein product [Rotaria sp. Silwood2]CAF4315125.1 unnamed protein product [Rotaria sp. Silwood2]